ncbi:WGR domain-containing protein [Sulfitobacter geojensis]|uniref:WGR domain-containing protein n=1 Tax=Sulfitobacter geojensis TaxID=1342299 RepID=A0AAE3B843_9RHOB|nr:WGR domain-containing protein [Sulfitobacter geojensis]MBM1691597.1 WGR domain-containing protein [Sulfitobacter geojensis]MBM1695652.1 WGR domain-containing protein [Sulfitobacter geojensis]MBM1707808.1 WGR domain-containing protein [Sulfitobacter geojensis]MBM1711865.1 WGR domain-containing protein [Sulfitobacter geojensis]MBM1715932.1 WGR domain-containing protein [Sulfitobacter geojensis]
MILTPRICSPQLEIFPDRICLHRMDSSRNMNRYYFMAVQPDLFGGVSLIREWGRRGSAGKLHVTHHADEGEAVNALADYSAQKCKRGYEVIV